MQRMILLCVSLLLMGCEPKSADVLQRISNLSDPREFATVLYTQVFANEYLSDSRKDEQTLAKQFFTDDLFKHLAAVYGEDAKLVGEVGCVDFRIFTGAQDVFTGFLIGAAKKDDSRARVSVYFGWKSKDFKKAHLDLHLVKTPHGWRIFDIVYHNPSRSLYSHLVSCLQQQGVFP